MSNNAGLRGFFARFAILALLAATGCSAITRYDQPLRDGFIALEGDHTAGQTFVARYRGLQGVMVYLAPQAPGTGSLVLHLRPGPQKAPDLLSASLPEEEIQAPGFYRFQFPPLKASNQQDYYFYLENQGDGSFQVGAAPGNSYISGSSYQDGKAQDSQLSFRLAYDPLQMAIGLGKEFLTWLLWLLAGLVLFVLPGWAVCSLLLSGWSGMHWAERFGLAGGLSLAIYPILLLWTGLLGMHLGLLYAWLPPVAGLLLLAWRQIAARRNRIVPTGAPLPAPSQVRRSWLPDFAFLVISGLIFATRFWAIRNLDAPMWGDSYQHALITQLILDHGGLFNSWAPYADLQTFTYHFGFHTLAAVFAWVTHLTASQATLWTGQIINAFAVIFLYPLALRLHPSRWAGVAAVLVAGLIAPMPMVYVNWGRYTQLTGQAILPAAVWLTWVFLESKKSRTDWGMAALLWIVLAGLALAHYRILIFYVIFLFVFFLLYLRRDNRWVLVQRGLLAGLGGGLIFLPWFIHVFSGTILKLFARQVTTSAAQSAGYFQQTNIIGDLFIFLPPLLWLLLPLAAGWGLWRRNRGIALVSLWWLLLFFAANPNWFNLPGTGTIGNFAVFIAVYIPAGVVLGAASGWFIEALQPAESPAVSAAGLGRWLPALAACIAIAIGVWGARERLGDVQIAQSALVTRPDLRAAGWIRENTPEKARFLVNTFFAFGDTRVVGSDAGWWLPLLANRSTTLPPINYGFEQEPFPNYRDWVEALPAEIQAKGADNPEILAMLKDRGIAYVYIGQQHGSVNNAAAEILQPDTLAASPAYSLVYHQDRVWIFKVNGVD